MNIVFDPFWSATRLPGMNSSRPPNKKPRLDNIDDWDEVAFGNDDLWGQGDLTAEEFDMLEVQATQKVAPGPSMLSSATNHLNSKNENDDEFRKEQYALQGQVKLLSETLDKTVRELSLERLNRQQIITQKLEESKNMEQKLEKEIEKMQTALQFKDQEMKASESKIHALEQKVKELTIKKNTSSQQLLSSQKKSDRFLNRFSFDTQRVVMKDSSVQVCEKATDLSKHKLNLLSAQGVPKNCDIVSSFLLNRRNAACAKLKSASQEPFNQFTSEAPFVGFAAFNTGNRTFELRQYYNSVLRDHISFLQKISDLNKDKQGCVKNIKLPQINMASSLSASVQQRTLGEEMEKHHSAVAACLKDLHLLCFPFESKEIPCTQQQNMQIFKRLSEPEMGACSSSLFPEEEKRDLSEVPSPCLQFLLTLANPKTYPDIYPYKQEELHLALSNVVEWSSRMSRGLEVFIYNLPLLDLVSGSQGMRCAYLALQLLFNVSSLPSFKSLMHQSESCIFTSIANLCNTVSNSDKNEYVQLISSVASFIGQCLSLFGTGILTSEDCSCSSQLTQGYIVMLWRYHDFCQKTDYSSPLQVDVLQRAVILLHQLSVNMLGFREKRSPVEDQYIVLVCGLSRITRDKVQFKPITDIIHELYDFQEMSDEADEHAD